MSNSTNKAAVPEAKSALERFKYEVASEIGVPLTDGYNGDLTSRQNGSVGGYMNILEGGTMKNWRTEENLNSFSGEYEIIAPADNFLVFYHSKHLSTSSPELPVFTCEENANFDYENICSFPDFYDSGLASRGNYYLTTAFFKILCNKDDIIKYTNPSPITGEWAASNPTQYLHVISIY